MTERLETRIPWRMERGLHADIGGRTIVGTAAWSVSLFGNRLREEDPLSPEAVEKRKWSRRLINKALRYAFRA